jgi:hypothetical protein
LEIEALAALAGNTIVAVVVTDAFEGVRAKVARIFGRGRSDERIKRRLDQTRRQLADAAPEERERAQETQARQWQTRIADLLADHPEAAGELQALLAELRSALPPAGGNVNNTITGTVHNGPVLMGRDFGSVTIGGRDDPPGD